MRVQPPLHVSGRVKVVVGGAYSSNHEVPHSIKIAYRPSSNWPGIVVNMSVVNMSILIHCPPLSTRLEIECNTLILVVGNNRESGLIALSEFKVSQFIQQHVVVTQSGQNAYFGFKWSCILFLMNSW